MNLVDKMIEIYMKVENYVKEVRVTPPEGLLTYLRSQAHDVVTYVTGHSMALTALAVGVALFAGTIYHVWKRHSMHGKIAELMDQLDDAQYWKRNYADWYISWRERAWSAEAAVEVLEYTVQERDNTIFHLTTERDEFSDVVDDLREVNKVLLDKVENLEEKLEEVEESLNDARGDVDYWEDKAFEYESERDEFESERDELEVTVSNLRQEVRDLSVKYGNASAANDVYAELVAELKAA